MQNEQPAVLYRLCSRDGQVFLVDRKTVSMIGRVDSLFANAGLDFIEPEAVFPIQLELSATVMRKVVEWCNHHKNDPRENDVEERESDVIPEWDSNLLAVRHNLLFDIIRAARNYDVPGLFSMCCRVVGQNPQEILRGLVDDHDDEEERAAVWAARRRWRSEAAAA